MEKQNDMNGKIERMASDTNSKIDRLASATLDRFKRVEGRIDQMSSMSRNIETQLGQIANAINSKNQGDLPSKTKLNPWKHYKAIILRSDRQLDGPTNIECEEENANEGKERE